MNLPNALTCLRFVLTGFFMAALYQSSFQGQSLALVLFIAASITDFLDGYIARKFQLITTFGKIMDPIADKFLTLSAFFIFADLGIVAFWMVALIAVREIGITLLRLSAMRFKQVFAAEKLGKYKTVLQIITIGVILIFMTLNRSSIEINIDMWKLAINGLMWLTLTLTLVSGISFLIKNKHARYV